MNLARIIFIVTVAATPLFGMSQTAGTFTVKKNGEEAEAHPLVGTWCLSAVKVPGEYENLFACDTPSVRWTFQDDGFYFFKSDTVEESGEWKFNEKHDRKSVTLSKRTRTDVQTGEVTILYQETRSVSQLADNRMIIQLWNRRALKGKFFYYEKL